MEFLDSWNQRANSSCASCSSHSVGLSCRRWSHLAVLPPAERDHHDSLRLQERTHAVTANLAEIHAAAKGVVLSPGSTIFLVLTLAVTQVCSEWNQINFSNCKPVLFLFAGSALQQTSSPVCSPGSSVNPNADTKWCRRGSRWNN